MEINNKNGIGAQEQKQPVTRERDAVWAVVSYGRGTLVNGSNLLSLASYRLRIRARDELRLPAFSGSAWRGVFGHALKTSVCVTRQKQCAGCTLLQHCVYSYIFETPLPEDSDRMRLYPYAPHPFVLVPDWPGVRTVAAGEQTTLVFRLFGKAIAHLPYVIHAFTQAGERGLGSSRGRYAGLSEVRRRRPFDNCEHIFELSDHGLGRRIESRDYMLKSL